MQTRWKRAGIIVIAALAFVTVGAYGLLDHYKTELYHGALSLQQDNARLQARRAQAAGFDWAYLENDQRGIKPTLLMVHGFGASKENWLDLAAVLKDDYHTVLVDLPGHGETNFDPALHYDLDEQVERLHQFLATIGLTSFHMIGNSMGGAITAFYAATYPAQVQSAVLLNPGGITDVKSEYNKFLDQGQNPLIVEDEDDFDFLVQFAMEQRPFIPWPISAVSTEKMRQRKDINAHIFADIVGAHRYDFKAVIAQISAPTLVVWGKQDRVLAAGNATEFQRLIPGSQVALLEDVGHAPMLEIPQQCADMVRNFTQTSL